MAPATLFKHEVDSQPWPELDYAQWKDTCATLHLWTQIVGKIRLAQTPWLNHAWHVPLYVTTQGLSTSPIPYDKRTFQIDFDLVNHLLLIETNDGAVTSMPLKGRSVADFYASLLAVLGSLGLRVRIHKTPSEMVDGIAFDQDHRHATYDPQAAHRFGQALVQTDRVFKQFRARFIGKCSPVHFFWGSFDLAVTRFSGRPAPQHPGGVPNCPDWVTREAYSHEVSSCGFWPGGEALPYPVFYAYAYPEPFGFKSAAVRPKGARYNADFHEFILPYEEVRLAPEPDVMLLDFLQSSYDAVANLGRWDRAALERTLPPKQHDPD